MTTNRKRDEEVKYKVNRRGEVIHAEVVPLPEITSEVGPTPREAVRQNTVAARAEENLDRRKQVLLQRLSDRREARAEERRVAIAQAALRAGDPEDRVTLEHLRLGDIVVPEEYQRSLDQDRAIGYALRFSWEAFQAISINRRPDGTLVLADGQHRLYAAQLAYGDDVLVKAVVTAIPNTPQEAGLFLTLNDERVGLNYNAKLKTRLHAQDAVALQMVALLAEFGLDYTRPGEYRGLPGKITAVSTLESMLRQGGPSSVRAVLSVLNEVFGDDADAYRDFMLSGLWQFVLRYDGLYRRERLLVALKRDGLVKIADMVSDFKTSVNSSGGAAACGAIHYAYNWHMQVRDALPPFATEARNRYSALIRKAAREWAIRHEGKNGALLPARPVTGLYAPGSQNPSSTTHRRANQLPD